MDSTVLRFNQALYPKEAVIKAAYHFINQAYIHVDLCDGYYVIHIQAKKKESISSLALEFENELLAQTVRFQVYTQTHVLRELLMARAMSSTITGGVSELENTALPDNLCNLDNILTDWFEKNEK
jgi:His-Xaa-Ser system protein HxsD